MSILSSNAGTATSSGALPDHLKGALQGQGGLPGLPGMAADCAATGSEGGEPASVADALSPLHMSGRDGADAGGDDATVGRNQKSSGGGDGIGNHGTVCTGGILTTGVVGSAADAICAGNEGRSTAAPPTPSSVPASTASTTGSAILSQPLERPPQRKESAAPQSSEAFSGASTGMPPCHAGSGTSSNGGCGPQDGAGASAPPPSGMPPGIGLVGGSGICGLSNSSVGGMQPVPVTSGTPPSVHSNAFGEMPSHGSAATSSNIMPAYDLPPSSGLVGGNLATMVPPGVMGGVFQQIGSAVMPPGMAVASAGSVGLMSGGPRGPQHSGSHAKGSDEGGKGRGSKGKVRNKGGRDGLPSTGMGGPLGVASMVRVAAASLLQA